MTKFKDAIMLAMMLAATSAIILTGVLLLSNEIDRLMPKDDIKREAYTVNFKEGRAIVTLYGQVLTADKYAMLSDDIKGVDVVYLRLLGPGGYMEGMSAITSAIKSKVSIAVIDGSIYSADAFLSISTDYVIFNTPKNVGVIMFHHHSGYRSTLATCVTKYTVDSCVKYLSSLPDEGTTLFKEEIKPFLTEQEYNYIFLGQDITISLRDFKDRVCKIEPKRVIGGC